MKRIKIISSGVVFGLLLLSMGLGYAYVQGYWPAVSLILVFLGGGSLFFSLFFIKPKDSQKLRGQNIQRKVFVVFGFGALIVLYILVNYLGHSYEKRFDLTRAKQHTLLSDTVRLVNQIEGNVQLTAFHVGIPPKYLEDLLNEYARQSKGRIVTEIIDPIVQIGYAAQFGTTISGKEHKLIVQSGNERRDVDFTKEPLSEEQVNNALLQVTREARTACFLNGHGERPLYDSKDSGLNKFVRHLLANNIMVQSVFLGSQKSIPEECQVFVVAGPEKHLSEDEVQIVQDYLEKGGDALFMIEHTVITTVDKPLTEQQEGLNPSLNEILSQWGLGIENDIVVDLASHASGDVGSPATKNYMAHKAIVGGLDYTFFVRPRSIRMLRDKPKDVKLAPLILTSSKETSWGESNRYLDVKFDPNEDRAGPVPIAFVGWQPQMGVSGKASDTRFIVVTDVDFISNALIDAYSNAQLGVNMLNWLTEKDYQTFLSKEGVDVIRLDLTSQQKRMIVAILMFTLLATASVGIWVWLGQLER